MDKWLFTLCTDETVYSKSIKCSFSLSKPQIIQTQSKTGYYVGLPFRCVTEFSFYQSSFISTVSLTKQFYSKLHFVAGTQDAN